MHHTLSDRSATTIRADFVSDTVTRPDAAMFAAIAAAPLGDEQREGDPTADRLAAVVAAMTGKEAGLFMPSGTLCNLVAVAVHCRPGEALIAERSSHVVTSELGGAAVVAGALSLTLEGERGLFDIAAVDRALDALSGTRAPRARLLCAEQTHNRGGGAVWPVARLSALGAEARARGLATHLDGARLLNAVAATGEPADRHAAEWESVWIDLSKGLGCPAGAVLCGSAAFVAEADVWKRRLGGALRQSGVLAAAALQALETHPDRFAKDNALARRIAEGLAMIPGVALLHAPVESNLIFVDVAATGHTAREIATALAAEGLRIGVEGPTRARIVTHCDLTEGDADALLDALRQACS